MTQTIIRLACLAMAFALAPLSAGASDEFTRAESLKPTLVALCPADGRTQMPAACQNGSLDRLAERAEAALRAALAKAKPLTVPLLKRDQVWFRYVLESVLENDWPSADGTDDQSPIKDALNERIATLESIKDGFGRWGVTGRWANTFGSLVMTEQDGALAVTLATTANYGVGEDRRVTCNATALVRPAPGGWLAGPLMAAADPDADTKDDGGSKGPAAGDATPSSPILKIRLQGETLRVVAGDTDGQEVDAGPIGCNSVDQLTGTYFAAGKAEVSGLANVGSAGFVAPSFDCARPKSASDEEICADPELADSDLKLNRAWAKLLPRLDAATRGYLVLDQRGYARSQDAQYPEFLHPAWEKQSSFMHHTGYGRDKLNRLQRERIAVLEGFDLNRVGFEGLWMAHTAILKVAHAEAGGLTAIGWKWDQGDWKAGCEYDMKGKVKGSAFVSDEARKNPDTLERDHASLIVNRLDDVFAKKRSNPDGTIDDGADEQKCRRNVGVSSTVRLFPVRPSPDIDNMGGSIR